ncbi:MAG: tyrosine-type recombinase/integrase, partial [Firmicutes bacterium]|nr:tyrosine-type recombinase/integrase [Bacillota bacterium]
CSREKAAAAGPGAGALRRPVAGPEPGRDAIRDARRGPEGRAVARLWEMYRRGLEISFYDLRHLHATYLLQLGVHPKVVAEDLGHSTTRLTLDTYSHVAPTLQQEAADKLDGLLRRNL